MTTSSKRNSENVMRNFIQLIIALGMAACWAQGHAQNLNRKRAHQALDDFRKEVRGELEEFRRQAMEDFISFLQNPWKEFEEEAPVPKPKDEPVPPVVIPDEDKDKPVEDNPVVIDDVVSPPTVEPQPQPFVPIEERPVVAEKTVTFRFFGSDTKVRCDISHCSFLHNVTPDKIGKTLVNLMQDEFDNMIIDCLHLRDSLHLSDWAYLQMLNKLSQAIAGEDTNGSTLLMAYLYIQSGYKMRLAVDGNKLYMLFASRHQIYERGAYEVDGDLYYGLRNLPNRLCISEANFPKEKSLSLLVTKCQLFARNESAERTIASTSYSEIQLTTTVNKNLIDFYNTYPSSILDNNVMTRWAMYANTPIDPNVKEKVCGELKRKLEGLSQLEAVGRLLNMVQTGLTYEYDDKVWGCDRAFFPEETLFYPYADCEDRAILFTRLIRDILGLECILVFYPGHLTAAVCFTKENVKGDYILLGDKRFVITDPTYIGASVGMSMPDIDNQTANVILLE